MYLSEAKTNMWNRIHIFRHPTDEWWLQLDIFKSCKWESGLWNLDCHSYFILKIWIIFLTTSASSLLFSRKFIADLCTSLRRFFVCILLLCIQEFAPILLMCSTEKQMLELALIQLSVIMSNCEYSSHGNVFRCTGCLPINPQQWPNM